VSYRLQCVTVTCIAASTQLEQVYWHGEADLAVGLNLEVSVEQTRCRQQCW
jgi:hypothetical protein